MITIPYVRHSEQACVKCGEKHPKYGDYDREKDLVRLICNRCRASWYMQPLMPDNPIAPLDGMQLVAETFHEELRTGGNHNLVGIPVGPIAPNDG